MFPELIILSNEHDFATVLMFLFGIDGVLLAATQ